MVADITHINLEVRYSLFSILIFETPLLINDFGFKAITRPTTRRRMIVLICTLT